MTSTRRGTTAKPFGTGQIIFWRGGSLWIGHAAEQTEFHAHHAIRVTLGLSGGPVRFRRPGQAWASYTAAIIAAHEPHAFEGCGELVALVFAEPESLEGRALRERYPEGVTSLGADACSEQAARLAASYAQDASDEELASCARAVTTRLSSIHPSSARPLDKRIARAVDILHGRLADAVTMSEIAEAVHLPPSVSVIFSCKKPAYASDPMCSGCGWKLQSRCMGLAAT
jgi:AraC family transcriptional regulator